MMVGARRPQNCGCAGFGASCCCSPQALPSICVPANTAQSSSSAKRTNEEWVTQDTTAKRRLTTDTHLPITKRRPNPSTSRPRPAVPALSCSCSSGSSAPPSPTFPGRSSIGSSCASSRSSSSCSTSSATAIPSGRSSWVAQRLPAGCTCRQRSLLPLTAVEHRRPSLHNCPSGPLRRGLADARRQKLIPTHTCVSHAAVEASERTQTPHTHT